MVDIKIDTHVAERPRALKIRKRRKTIFFSFALRSGTKNKVKDIHLTSALSFLAYLSLSITKTDVFLSMFI